MSKKIVFATHNRHKLHEIRSIIGSDYEIVGLDEIGCCEDIPETGSTLQENALQKAHYVVQKYGIDCFADDTGLEVDALNGAPGVYSARYAGESCSFADNVEKLLKEMSDKENRSARFKTVIALIIDHKEFLFEGKVEGQIGRIPHGTDGFGYDPIFIPDGYQETFSQMSLDEKNKISHRGLATQRLMQFLQTK
ncbi:MAG: non-canonical purine NTP diphosphatase [Bacteroidales bacterium]|nr:non-canonical purine NTP diphosphatase [Bacteroidales bacterium]